MDMMFVLCFIGMTHGFLLDSKNSSHTGTFLTVSEYYNDKTRTEQIIDNVRQELIADKLASQRNLQLLATQIQDQLTAFQQELKSNTVANAQQASITDLEQQYHDLEIKYGEMKNSTVSLQQKYDNLAMKNLNLEQENRELKQKVEGLEQLRGINQLQTLREVQEKTQTLDTRVTALANTEQARSQDFMALYQKLNSLETSETIRNNQTNERIEELTEYHNQSLSMMQEHINKQLQPVVLTACHTPDETMSAGAMRFKEIRTAIGIPDSDLSIYKTSGKFKCQVPGYYYISTSMETTSYQASITFMLNSESKQSIQIVGKTDGYYTAGTSSYTFKLTTNDEVWLQINGNFRIKKACLSIFKIM